MYFILISLLSVALAALPVRMSLLGRALAIISAASCWIFGTTLLNGAAPAGVGALGRFVNLEAGVGGAEANIATVTFFLTALACLSYRRQTGQLSFSSLDIKLPKLLTYSTLAFALFSAFYIAATLGPENIISYSGYGSIKALSDVYEGNTFGKLVATVFRPIVTMLIAIAIYNYYSGHRNFAYLSAIPIFLAFALGLSEASRIVSVYFGVAALSFLIFRKRFLALLVMVLAFLSVAFALEARNNQNLGLAYVAEYLDQSLQSEGIFESVLTNVASGMLVTSATARVALPDSYSEIFKILSFAPTVDAIDGFQSVKAVSEQRILSYIPFNAFGEAWAFGPFYYVLLWVVLAIAALCVNSSAKFGIIPFLVLMSIFLLGWVFASQYPVRNSLRYFYIVIAARAALPAVMGYLQARATRRQRAAQKRLGISETFEQSVRQ